MGTKKKINKQENLGGPSGQVTSESKTDRKNKKKEPALKGEIPAPPTWNICANGTQFVHSYAFSKWKGLDWNKLKAVGANQVKEAEKKFKQGLHDEASEMFRDAILRLAGSIHD